MTEYEHRQMRCKSGASIYFRGRRYRPGEVIEIDVPEEYRDMVEPVPEPPPPPPEPEKPRFKNPPPEPPVSQKIPKGMRIIEPFKEKS
jgi:hypothetical protein